jgi:hypothetical protein
MRKNWNFVRSALILGVVSLSPLALSGCEEKGPAEKAGEKLDDAAKDAKKAIDNIGK